MPAWQPSLPGVLTAASVQFEIHSVHCFVFWYWFFAASFNQLAILSFELLDIVLKENGE